MTMSPRAAVVLHRWVQSVVLPSDVVDARCRIPLQHEEGRPESVDADVVQERGEPRSLVGASGISGGIGRARRSGGSPPSCGSECCGSRRPSARPSSPRRGVIGWLGRTSSRRSGGPPRPGGRSAATRPTRAGTSRVPAGGSRQFFSSSVIARAASPRTEYSW